MNARSLAVSLRTPICAVLLGLFGLVCMDGDASAETLYQQQVNQTEISDTARQEALKQIREYKEIKVLDALSVAPFHKRDALPTAVKRPFCAACHLPVSHRKNERSRTFLNMHSRYIACETCHFRPDDIQLEYRWLAYDGPEAGQEIMPRNTPVDIQSGEHPAQKPLPLAPVDGARITSFYQGEPVSLFNEGDFAGRIVEQWKTGNELERAELKVRLHAPLDEKGPACQGCHGNNEPLLDLQSLGASPERVKQFQQNTLVQFFTRFKKDDERIRIRELLR